MSDANADTLMSQEGVIVIVFGDAPRVLQALLLHALENLKPSVESFFRQSLPSGIICWLLLDYMFCGKLYFYS